MGVKTGCTVAPQASEPQAATQLQIQMFLASTI